MTATDLNKAAYGILNLLRVMDRTIESQAKLEGYRMETASREIFYSWSICEGKS
jgi:hypothetical protein